MHPHKTGGGEPGGEVKEKLGFMGVGGERRGRLMLPQAKGKLGFPRAWGGRGEGGWYSVPAE